MAPLLIKDIQDDSYFILRPPLVGIPLNESSSLQILPYKRPRAKREDNKYAETCGGAYFYNLCQCIVGSQLANKSSAMPNSRSP